MDLLSSLPSMIDRLRAQLFFHVLGPFIFSQAERSRLEAGGEGLLAFRGGGILPFVFSRAEQRS